MDKSHCFGQYENNDVVKMSTNVCCIGELLIDMFCTDVDISLKQAENFKRKIGGTPANVAVIVANFGGEGSIIGKMGNEAFGEYLINTSV